MKIRVNAEKNFDLSNLVLDINDGLLDDIAQPDEVKVEKQAAKLFSGGDQQIVKLELIFKVPLSAELKASIIAAIRKIIGNKAHIVEID